MISFAAGTLLIGLDDTGRVISLLDTEHQRERLAAGPPAPLLSVEAEGQTYAPTVATWDARSGALRLDFGASGFCATVTVAIKPTHTTFQLTSLEGSRPTKVLWGPWETTIDQTVGAVVGVVRDDDFALGLQALNIQTVGGAARTDAGSRLFAHTVEHEGGVSGTGIALFGCPPARALETLGQIELAEGLPHPMLDDVWGKVSPTASLSYLIAWDFGDAGANLEALFDLAGRAGIRYLYHGGPFLTWGHFQLDPRQFPQGDASLRDYVERAAARGIRLGVHTLTGFITTNDPYVTPVPDPRLARWGTSTLAAPVDARETEITVASPEAFRRRGTLSAVILGAELVQFGGLSAEAPWKLLDCRRGAFGTTASAHAAGADIGMLADHGYRTFYPGWENGMLDEMTARLVELFNITGLRQMSFDGLEGLSTYDVPGDYLQNRFVTQCFDGWQEEVITDASNLLHYLWHVHTRMNWGELGQSEKLDVDYYRLDNCQFFEDNLFPKAMGWWRFGSGSLEWEASRLEDAEYLLAKCAGWNATHALETSAETMAQHGYAAECLELVKNWDEARYLGAFSEAQRARLRQKGHDFHLARTGERRWALNEVKFSPLYWLCPGTGRAQPPDPAREVLSFNSVNEEHAGLTCAVNNPWSAQPMQLEMRLVSGLDYARAGNLDLTTPVAAEFARGPRLLDSSPEITVTAARVSDQPGYQVSARHEGPEPLSPSTRVVADFAAPLDLSAHRALGFWVRGDGQGELLFVELSDGEMLRQFYVLVDFTGERYFEFPLGEACAHRYYSYKPWDTYAAWDRALKWFDYRRVTRLTLGFHRIPAGHEVNCAVGGLKALQELDAPVQNLAFELHGQRMAVEGVLPGWTYLIYRGGETAEVRDKMFQLLREVPVFGDRLEFAPGENLVRVSYEGAGGPAPWARLEFRCDGPPEEVAAPVEPSS